MAKEEIEIPKAPFYHRVHTPTIIQMEAVECGAASLGIILSYYGKFVTLEELRTACGVTRDGVSALGIITAAEFYELDCEAHGVELEELYDMPLPAIAYWNFEHFVVIEGFSRDSVFINDPACGPSTIPYEELDLAFTGLVMTFEPNEKFKRSGKPPNAFKSIINRIKDSKLPFFFSFLVGLCLVFPKLAFPALTQIFIDNILVNHIYSWQYTFIFCMVFITLITITFKYLQKITLTRLFTKLSIKYSSQFLNHILRLPIGFYAQRYSGEIANRMEINNTIADTICNQLADIFIDALLIVFFALIMFYYDPLIALFGILMTIGNILTVKFLYRSRKDAYGYFQQATGKSVGYSIGSLSNIETIKAMSVEYKLFGRWAGYYTKSINAFQEISKKEIIAGVLPSFLEVLTTLAVLGFGAYRVINGFLTVGMLIALRILMANFMEPLTRLVNFSQTAQFLQIDIQRIDDVIKNPIDPILVQEEKNDNLQTNTEKTKLNGYVELKNISFGFNLLADPVIKDLNFKLSPGRTIALVGPTGSGKSTISKIIGGLVKQWGGQILFDGIERNALPRSLINNSLAVVEQEPFIFSGTVKQNITCFDLLPDQQEMIQAAKDACVHEEIMMRKGGYDLLLESGGKNISGGQKQRIEIARALVRRPSILILDEATSALDSDTEEKVVKNIHRRGCTCIIIAHRLSTIRTCDEIIILDKGQIVDRGSHKYLSEKPGLYKTLLDMEKLNLNPDEIRT